jgi:hypothetical protein
MKRIRLICGALFFGICANAAADPEATYEQVPLPSGPIIKRAPDFSEWKITFVYAPPPSPQGGALSQPTAPYAANLPGSHLPRLLTVTRTKPRWHSILVDVSGVKSELWFDGSMRFEVGQKDTDVLPIAAFDPGFSAGLLDYSSGHDFPDVGWVSPSKYLGRQKGTTLWVFQDGPDGAMVWVDSNTHYPVRWQKLGETRTIQFVDPPTELLTLPPNIANLASGLKKLDELSRAAPPHL